MRYSALLALLPAIAAFKADLEPIPTLESLMEDTKLALNVTPLDEPVSPKWACDIRAWTRAADLYPGAKIPGDARLAMNGTECDQVVKWQVGLRYLERAIIKKIADDAVLPVKPNRPKFDHQEQEFERNSILATDQWWFFRNEDEEYRQAMEEYDKQMKNEELWFIKGQYRTVFDLVTEMPLPSTKGDYTDLTESFAVHVPMTNFPPIERDPFYVDWTSDSQTLGTETLSEYYHLIHLANGTVLDLPAGRFGFIPLPGPVRPLDTKTETKRSLDWPIDIELVSQRNDTEIQEEDDYDFYLGNEHRGPDCDRGNKATFSLNIKSNITQPVLGQNMTLDLVLKRQGNGTEYPLFLDIGHAAERNITWAYNFIHDDTTYQHLVDGSPHRSWRRLSKVSVLAIPDAKALQKLKSEEEEMRSGKVVIYDTPWLDDDRGISRYHFDTDKKEPKETYTFSIDINFAPDDYPSFVKTFEDLRSVLDIKLVTYFLCDTIDMGEDENEDSEGDLGKSPSLGFTKKDKEWKEYTLPIENKDKSDRLDQNYVGTTIQHTASIPINVKTPPRKEKFTRHYMDSEARSPIMTRNIDDEITFPLLDQTLHDEEGVIKRMKWEIYDEKRQIGWCRESTYGIRNCGLANGGGGGYHAARLWESKMVLEKENEKKGMEEVEKGMAKGFVVQA